MTYFYYATMIKPCQKHSYKFIYAIWFRFIYMEPPLPRDISVLSAIAQIVQARA